jgi:hypothetical protein
MSNRGSFNSSLARASGENFDYTLGGHGQCTSVAEMLTDSMANELIAPANNQTERELFRLGWGNNMADALAQDLFNSFFQKG